MSLNDKGYGTTFNSFNNILLEYIIQYDLKLFFKLNFVSTIKRRLKLHLPMQSFPNATKICECT